MTKIILEVTDEQLERLDSIDLFNIDMAGVLYQHLTITSADEESKGEWIPVSERMPKDEQNVLFCDIDDDIMVGYHLKGRPNTHFSQDGSYEDMKNVRAWQPLPEPYKKGE